MSLILDLARGLSIPLLIGVVGRVWLAVLPPGSIGGHSPREWPRTSAASLAMGTLSLAMGWNLFRGFGVADPLPWLVGVTLLAAVLRLLALPGAMVPRREVAVESETWNSRILLGLSVSAALWTLSELLRQGSSTAPVTWVTDDRRSALGSWLKLGEGLYGDLHSADLRIMTWCVGVSAWIALHDCARVARTPLAPARAILLLGWLAPHHRSRIESADLEGALAVLLLAIAWASGVRWLRRADHRARLLTVGALGGLVVLRLEWSIFAATVAFGMLLAGARPQRKPLLTSIVAFAFLAVAPALWLGYRIEAMPQVARPFGIEAWARGTLGLGPLAVLVGIGSVLHSIRERTKSVDTGGLWNREVPWTLGIYMLSILAWTQIVAGVQDVALMVVLAQTCLLVCLGRRSGDMGGPAFLSQTR